MYPLSRSLSTCLLSASRAFCSRSISKKRGTTVTHKTETNIQVTIPATFPNCHVYPTNLFKEFVYFFTKLELKALFIALLIFSQGVRLLLGAILNNHYEVENVSGTICPNFWNVVNKHRMLHKEIKGRILGHQPTDSHRSSNKDL